jgi:hypothetical protein
MLKTKMKPMKTGTKYKDLCGNGCTLIAVQMSDETGRDDAWVQYEWGFVKKTTISSINRFFTKVENSKSDRVLACAKALGARLRARIASDDIKSWPGDRAALLELDLIEAEIYRMEML